MQDMTDIFGPVISSYTRADAIADGVLVDMTEGEFGKMAQEYGFVVPIAMTVEAFTATVATDKAQRAIGQDEPGRWWDVLTMLKHAISRREVGSDRVEFAVQVANGRTWPSGAWRHERVELWCHSGKANKAHGPLAGDGGEHVLTIMLRGQD